MPKFDREKFNTDPKHEEERTVFDQMTEDSLKRLAERKKKEEEKNPPKNEKGFLDEFLESFFGPSK